MNQPATPPPASAVPPWPPAGVAWYAVVVLFAAFILSFIARLIVSLLVPSLKLPPEQGGLGLSDADIGVLQGPGFVLFYAVVGILIGRLADRYSRRGIIAAGIAGWSLMTVACGLARNFNQLLGARVGVGIGQSALSPAAYSMIADLFPRDRLGRALGVYQAGGLVGTGLAFLVGGLVIRAVSTSAGITLPVVGTVAGWQFAFIAVGLPGFLVALLLATVPEPLRRSAAAAAGGSGAVLAYLGSRLRVYGLHYAGFALLAMPYTIIAAWSPVLFQRVHGYTPPEAGLALGAILAVASPLGVLSGGFLADRLQQRGARDAALVVGFGTALVLLPVSLAATLVTDAGTALLLFAPFVFCASLSLAMPPAALQVVTPGPLRAQVSAIWLLVLNLVTGLVGALGVGLLNQFLFADDAAIGKSMALLCAVSLPLAALALAACRGPFRAAAAAAG
jgi:MFS family permease